MQTKQNIVIIGATGNMGSALAKSLMKGNYRLLLFTQHPDQATAFAETLKRTDPAADIEAVDCSYNACWEADIIIVVVPFAAEKEVAKKIKDVANQKIVISISNPVNEKYDGLITDADTSAAEELQKLLPNSKVIKAFNTIFAVDFAQSTILGQQIDAFIAGNDKEAIQIVAEMVNTAGFNPVIAGGLSVSRTLESMQLLLMRLNLENDYKGMAAWKILH